jgi:hypothetical protein
VSARYEFIDAQKAHYPITKMITWLGVSSSASSDHAGLGRGG